MNLFQALGSLLLITGLIVGLLMYDPDNVAGGALTILIDLWLPILCVLGGIGLIVKGMFWKPPTKRRGSASSSKNSGKSSSKKSGNKSRKKKK